MKQLKKFSIKILVLFLFTDTYNSLNIHRLYVESLVLKLEIGLIAFIASLA